MLRIFKPVRNHSIKKSWIKSQKDGFINNNEQPQFNIEINEVRFDQETDLVYLGHKLILQECPRGCRKNA